MAIINRIILNLFAGLLLASAAISIGAQQSESKSTNLGVKNIPSFDRNAEALTPSQQSLVAGSKNAIIGTGISERYFVDHFKLLQVTDRPADRHVRWKYSINGYETILNDPVGYYTEGNRRMDTHGIAKTLGQTSDISRTILRSRAFKLMRTCIGDFVNASVEYRPYGADDHAELVLLAQTKQRRERKSDRDVKREKRPQPVASERDAIETEEDEGGPPIIIGAINLQTGKCMKGAAMVTP